jgi:hypothetical protein
MQSAYPGEGSVPESLHTYERPESREPEQDGPSRESIARARAAQQRERTAFTMATGVAVSSNGVMVRRSSGFLTEH